METTLLASDPRILGSVTVAGDGRVAWIQLGDDGETEIWGTSPQSSPELVHSAPRLTGVFYVSDGLIVVSTEGTNKMFERLSDDATNAELFRLDRGGLGIWIAPDGEWFVLSDKGEAVDTFTVLRPTGLDTEVTSHDRITILVGMNPARTGVLYQLIGERDSSDKGLWLAPINGEPAQQIQYSTSLGPIDIGMEGLVFSPWDSTEVCVDASFDL